MDLLQCQIFQLCSCYPEGLLLSQLPSLYEQTHTVPLKPSAYGFSSLMDLLEAMNDVLTLHFDGCNCIVKTMGRKESKMSRRPSDVDLEKLPQLTTSQFQKSAQVDDIDKLRGELLILLSCYPGGIRLNQITRMYKKKFEHRLKAKHYGFHSLEEMAISMDDILDRTYTETGIVVKANSSLVHVLKRKAITNLNCTISSSAIQPLVQKEAQIHSHAVYSLDLQQSKGERLSVLQGEIVTLLKYHPHGIAMKKIKKFYQQMYQRKLDLTSYHLQSVKHLLKHMKDKVFIQESGSYPVIFETAYASAVATQGRVGAQYYKRAKQDVVPVPEFCCVKQADMTEFVLYDQKMQKLHSEILDLFKTHPDGIPESKLAEIYCKAYKHNLKAKNYGFRSLQELINSMSHLLLVVTTSNRVNLLKLKPLGDPGVGEMNGNKSHRATVSGGPSPAANLGLNKSPLDSSTFPLSPQQQVTAHMKTPAPMPQMKLGQVNNSIISGLQQRGFASGLQLPVVNRPEQQLAFGACSLMSTEGCKLSGESVKIRGHAEEAPSKKNPMSTFAFGTDPGKSTFTFGSNLETVWDTQKLTVPPIGQSFIGSIKNQLIAHEASPEDFPELDPKLTKLKLKKLQEETLRKKRSESRFPDRYYAQVREEHSSVMQAVEMLDADTLVGGGSRRVDVETVNQLTQEFIRALATEGEHVTEEKVLNRVCRHLRVQSLKKIGIWSPPRQIPAIQDLRRTQREVTVYIEAFESIRSVCTLYELNKCLAALKGKNNFEELNLGPLCKQPLVHRMFKAPQSLKDEDIFEVETVDIMQSLRAYRKIAKVSKIDLADFIKHLADKYNCDSPYELGIRISSIGLLISNLSKTLISENAAMENARNRIQREIEEEVSSRMQKIKKSLLDPASGPQLYSTSGSLDLRKHYASSSAVDVVLEIFSKADGIFSKKMTRHFQEFLLKVLDDRLARSLFQLALCCGALEVPQDLVAKEQPCKPTANTSVTNKTLPPSEGVMREYMQKNLSSVTGVLNLTYLSRLERKLLDHFKLEGFSRTGHGTFLEYLVKHPQMLEEAGGGSLVLSNQDVTGCGFRPSHQDVYEFIRQCENLEESVFPAIEAALRSHFGVKDSKELGYGTFSNMVKMVQRQIRSLNNHGNLRSLVLYEAALLVKESISIHSNHNRYVGLLGELSKERALSCLLNAPLLEDLAEWSQWDLVFEPQHGSLKDFIERNCDKKAAQLCVEGSVLNDLVAMEVKPGILLRLTTDSSPDLFAKAAESYDPVGTAGHLVSIVTADGLTNAPLALLANHMETALAALGGLQGLMMNGGTSSDRSAQFILDCLIRIPIRLCKSLLHKVFLEPFSRVIGQSESKDLILQTAKCSVRYQNKLHQLGIILGVTEWMRDFHSKLDPAKLSIITSKTTQFVDSSSVSSRSSVMGQSEGEDSESDSDLEPEITSNSSDDEGDGKFVLASKDVDLPACNKLENESDVEVQTSTALDPADGISTEGCVTEADQEKAIECRNIIQDIRKSDFGIGVELNEEGKKLVEVHQNRLGRSLERLSTELYSKDTHFVLELIQNADDNRYPACSATPSLLFVVESDCIMLLNNECGFEENNIRAICDVGHSTKGKHKYGYIGQKGIGFKSVFKVTNKPEIHSNGFHICFDKNSGPMGYILPHWVENERPVDLTDLELAATRWTTKIILPLKSQNQQTQNLFHDVDPSLLLFLHRLRSINIINKVRDQDFSVTRRDLSDNILEIKHKVGADYWLVIKTILDARKIKENVECTELALAFKLDLEKKNAQDHNFQPEKQPVFAFLPLRNFGFRFIIQGDFDIPSSREDIDRDSPWNQWLRSEIPLLFLQAMEVFINHPSFKGLEGLCHFLKFIPLPDEILDFFRPIAGQIIHLLKAKACLPTKTDKDGKIEYRLPSQTAITHDVLVQEVIDSELLQKHLNLAYLNPGIQSELSPALASVLGVHKLTSADIIAVTKAIAKEIDETGDVPSDDCIKRIAKLLVCNFRSLEQEYSNFNHLVEDLKSIPIIPLADGKMVSLKGQAIFFPLFDEENSELLRPTKGIQDLYKDLKTIHPNLLICLDNLGNSQVRKLLEKMDVHYLKPEKVVLEHILPILKEHKWQEKTDSTVISYVVFLKMNCQDGELEQFKDFVPVLTNKGFVCPSQVNVNFPCDYKNVINLLVDFPGVDWHLLDSCYLKIDNDTEGWRRFFTIFGVRDLFIFRKKNYNFTKQELASSPWAFVSEFWPKTADDIYVVEDHACEELHTLLTMEGLSDEVKLMQRINLLKLLDKNWDSGCRISQYCTVDVFDSRGQRLKDGVCSALSVYLTTLPWLPAYGCGSSATYLRPNEVYLKEKHLFELLSHHVSYVPCELLEKSSFAAFTGIKTSLTVEVMISHFKTWCVQKTANPCDSPQGAEFQTSADHIHNVYSYLGSHCNQHQLKQLFECFPAVFVPTSRDEKLRVGKFYHQRDVCWTDPTKMFFRYKSLINKTNESMEEPHILECYYRHWEDMRDLFQKRLNIERIPTMKQYVELLVLMCSETSLPNSDILQDVSVIYATLAEKCKYTDSDGGLQLDDNYCKTLKGMLKDEKVFAAKDNLWVSLARYPIIPDNKHLERVFKSYPQVCLLNLPLAERNTSKTRTPNKQDKPCFDEEDREIFLKVCGVKRLSECVMVEAQTENFRPCPAIQNFVHTLVPYIQRFLYGCEEFYHVYTKLKQNDIVGTLKSINFIQVGKLYLQYQLTLPDTETLYEKEDIVCHLKGNKQLYIQKDHIGSRTDICRELVKLFNCAENNEFGKELERFLQGLVSCLQEVSALKRLLEKEDAGELPEDEERWEVPQVCEPRPQPMRLPAPIQIPDQDQKETPECKDSSNDGEMLLTCWPPKSSLHGVPEGRTNKAVDNVMRMWPPPAGPAGSSGYQASGEHPHPPQAERSVGGTEPPMTSEEKRDFYQSQPMSPKPNTNQSVEQPPAGGRETRFVASEQTRDSLQSQAESPLPPGSENPEHPSAPGTEANNTGKQQSATLVPKGNFNGFNAHSSRPALPLDFPIWTREQPYEEVLEELVIHSAVEKPQTVVFSEGSAENAAIGEWGERLVHAFLLQWKESNCEHKPQEVQWVNEKGESGLPYDFRVVFTRRGEVVSEATFLEVKSTIKADKNFVQLSAKEVELALRAKEHYHMYRVYKAGDSHNVRLCRIENLAKCLNAKQLALFLFV